MESKLGRMRKAEEHVNLGIAYSSTGMEEEAIDEFKKALELYWGYGKAHYCLARTHFDLMQFDLAWRHARIANRLSFPAGKLIEDLESISREPTKVADIPEKEMKREELEKHFRRGILCAEKGRFDEAVAEFRGALKIAPSDGEIHQFLGSTYGEKARLEMERGRGRFAGKLFERAWRHLHSAEKLGVDVSEIMRRLGRYAAEEGEGTTSPRS